MRSTSQQSLCRRHSSSSYLTSIRVLFTPPSQSINERVNGTHAHFIADIALVSISTAARYYFKVLCHKDRKRWVESFESSEWPLSSVKCIVPANFVVFAPMPMQSRGNPKTNISPCLCEQMFAETSEVGYLSISSLFSVFIE